MRPAESRRNRREARNHQTVWCSDFDTNLVALKKANLRENNLRNWNDYHSCDFSHLHDVPNHSHTLACARTGRRAEHLHQESCVLDADVPLSTTQTLAGSSPSVPDVLNDLGGAAPGGGRGWVERCVRPESAALKVAHHAPEIIRLVRGDCVCRPACL